MRYFKMDDGSATILVETTKAIDFYLAAQPRFIKAQVMIAP